MRFSLTQWYHGGMRKKAACTVSRSQFRLTHSAKPKSHLRSKIVLATCLAAGSLVMPETSLAQSAQQASPAVLTDIDLISENADESHFILKFAPRLNSYGSAGSQASQISEGFALTTRANSATAPAHLSGFVRAITFDQADTVLIVRFAVAAGSRNPQIKVKQLGPGSIDLTVTSGVDHASKSGTGPATPTPSPSHAPNPDQMHELVQLDYADVSEVVGILTDGLTVKSNDNFVPREPGFGSTSLTGGGYTSNTVNQNPSDSEPVGQSVDGAVAIDRRLNAIWLKGSAEEIARMKAQIRLVDIPVESVLLETQIVELDENAASAIGINFNNAAGQLAVLSAQSGQYISSGLSASNGGHLNGAGAVVGGYLTSAALQASISAQVSKGKGKILSRPRIVAQSGGNAKIITGDALPILTAITLSGVNGVSQQVQYVNVGVTLQIAPRVSRDGFVTSHVFCVVSSETGISQGYPTISQREAETMVTVKDGETFVIGGLTQDTASTSDSKLPLLGDIPLIGQAFHNKTTSRQKTELYIIVTPHVIHNIGYNNVDTIKPDLGP